MKLVSRDHLVLRREALPVARVTKACRRNIYEMSRILAETHAVGIAAPQVGLSLAIFLTDVPSNVGATEHLRINGIETDMETCRPLVFINPVVSVSGKVGFAYEGCLSLPDVKCIVARPLCVSVRFQNMGGEHMLLETSGFFARVIQHEFDHLQGKLISDYPPVSESEVFL